MQLRDGQPLYSATDLVAHLSCAHLTTLGVELLEGRIDPPPTRSASTADLAAEKGDEHERQHLERLRAHCGGELVEIEKGSVSAGLEKAAEATRRAMKAGAPMIYQATFLDAPWMGYADFIERVDEPSELGGWSYIPIDTKLARSVKPYFIIQLCLYAALIETVQGCAPKRLDLILGDDSRPSLRHDEFRSYFDRMRQSFLTARAKSPADTYPEPVPHCEVCKWADSCEERRIADDHLTQVANLGRAQESKLARGGITTVADLANASGSDRPLGMSEATFVKLRSQAALQVAERDSGQRRLSLLEPSKRGEEIPRGFALLPQPNEGDLFFDIEGDPFYENKGLEYLWGVTYLEGGEPRFRAFWGLNRRQEKQAFEEFVDFVMDRRQSYPDMHVYHYAPYERTALGRMMGDHATREDEVDSIFRDEVLVDLYRVVAQSMQISRPSYSLKEVEHFYGQDRDADVKQAGDSVLMFEKWLTSSDQKLLDEIEAYNTDDCDSTLHLRNWLIEQRSVCETQFGQEIPWREPAATEESSDTANVETIDLQGQLLEGVPDEPSERSDEQADRWLLAQLLDYHRRDAKPGWWEFFARLTRSEVELIEQDSEALGGLFRDGDPTPLPPPARSSRQQFSFPAQEHKVSPGRYMDPHSCGIDPVTGKSDQKPKSLEVVKLDNEQGSLVLKLSDERLAEEQHALIPGGPIGTDAQRSALRSLAAEAIEKGLDGVDQFRAGIAILRRSFPRSSAVGTGEPLQGDSIEREELSALVAGLDGSYLFIQGPPGSGKTYTGAHLICDLIDEGATVGVTANSHKAINNLLTAVESAARERQIDLRGLKKSSGEEQDHLPPKEHHGSPLIENSRKNGDFEGEEEHNLLAGTAWLWSREGMRHSVGYLFVDEAGQISLADALALSTATENMVLLGDPLQLGQVSQGSHPLGSGASVLKHLLGEEGTIPAERGIFLDKTRRMHPDICRFVSAAVYEERLSSEDFCARQQVENAGGLTGTGIRSLQVLHQGNTRSSPEEAEVIAEQISSLTGARFTNDKGEVSELQLQQILVVTPYNSQVRCLRDCLDRHGLDEVEVGTVDKFQGQEGAVVFFSMATSSAAEIPRNVEFLYSRNRLNVAVSRAQCLAVLVASPDLLEIECHTIEQIRLLNALCLLDSMGRNEDNRTTQKEG